MVEWIVKTNENKACIEALHDFKKQFDEEWKKQTKAIPFLKGMSIEMNFIDEERGVRIFIPFKTPMLGRILSGWKARGAKQIEGFLKEKGVKFKQVEFLRD